MSEAAETLEREDELDRIAAALDATVAGSGRTLLIEGPAGIGKTRLLQDARALAKIRGLGRLHTTCDEFERAIPWGALRQMVERSLWRHDQDTRAALLAGVAGKALAALDEAPAEGGGEAAIGRTLHALWWIVADLASSRPLLISVDDAQWSDVPSLRFFGYLARRVGDLPVALVIATRPPQERRGPLAELTAARVGEHLEPRPLSRDAVATLLSAGHDTLPADAVVAAIHDASGGNPFLASELLDDLSTRGANLGDPRTAAIVSGLGPSAIARALLARLPDDAVTLAGAAAVLGTRGDRSLAAAIAGLSDAPLAEAMDALVAGHVIFELRGKLVFSQPVVREAVLAQLGPGARAALHATAARTLHDSGASVSRVAAHVAYAPMGTLPGAAGLLCEAAASLLADGDALAASKYLNRALEHAPSDEAIEARLGYALLAAGEPERARVHLRSAAQTAADRRAQADLLAAAASATSLVDGPAVAVRELRAQLAGWPPSDADPARLVLEARHAVISSMLPEESQAVGERLRQFAGLPGETPEQRTLLALLAQRERYDVSPAPVVAAIAGRALGAGAYLEDVADGADGMVGWVVAMMALIAADGLELATAELARARERVRDRGSALEFGMVCNVAAAIGWRAGDVMRAGAESEASLAAVAAEDPAPTVIAVRATAAYFAVWAALERGELAAAQAMLERFDETCPDAPPMIPVTWLRARRALVAMVCGEHRRALDEALATGEAVRAAGVDTPTVPWRIPAVLAALRLDERPLALELAEQQLALARRWGASSELGAALCILARVDADRRIALLTEAIAALDDAPGYLELSRALIDLGEALRVAGRRAEAHAPLERGAELAAECGSRVLRERALEGLAALGDRPRKLMFSGTQSLTASERRVAQLAGEGRSNRDIAQELFVSPKTIENHLGRVYVKLGITSRRQLAGVLD